MGWFSPSRTALRAPETNGRYRSLALPVVLRSLKSEANPSILDLGPAVGANFELLAHYSCRVRIADLYGSLALEAKEAREPRTFGKRLEALLPLESDERHDAVFVWDVLNYLKPEEITALAARLFPACAPGALMLVLVSTLRQLPGRPRRYRILDGETLAAEGVLEPSRPSPRYSPWNLTRLLSGFAIKHSFLLRSGIQEYVFVRS